MDIESTSWDQPTEDGGGRLNRLIAYVNGHTHIYQFPDDETPTAYEIIRQHVAEGQLHPYAGLVLITMLGGSDEP